MKKIILMALAFFTVVILVQSCAGNRKCDGNRRIRVPMGYM